MSEFRGARMTAHLLQQVDGFLRDLQTAQEDFRNLFREKRVALTAARADELQRLADRETSLAGRLRSLLGRRQQILQQARDEGIAADSLAGLARQSGSDGDGLRRRIDRLKSVAENLRRDGWVQWIVAQRAFAHNSQLLDMVAHHGRKAPTYGDRGDAGGNGGALLDASA